MSTARRSDGLLSARQTIGLLRLIEENRSETQTEQLLRNFAASHAGAWSRARNTVAFLCELEILEEDSGHVRMHAASTSFDQAWFIVIGQTVAKLLATHLSTVKKPGCLQADKDGGFWVNSMLLPGASEGIPLWIIEFAIATRESLGSHFWRIAPEYESLFRESVRRANQQNAKRPLPVAKLDARLAENRAQGREAEEWIVTYERARLASHPFIDQIRCISEEDVSAGYDIVSFSSETALYHDRFIEVKSFSAVRRFYWSRNEIAVAEELGEDYCLYLVDRTKIGLSDDYHPQIIRGPYSALITLNNDDWTITPSTYEFSHIECLKNHPFPGSSIC